MRILRKRVVQYTQGGRPFCAKHESFQHRQLHVITLFPCSAFSEITITILHTLAYTDGQWHGGNFFFFFGSGGTSDYAGGGSVLP